MKKVTQTKKQKQLIRDLIKIVSRTSHKSIGLKATVCMATQFYDLTFPNFTLSFGSTSNCNVEMKRLGHKFYIDSEQLVSECQKIVNAINYEESMKEIEARSQIVEYINSAAKFIKS